MLGPPVPCLYCWQRDQRAASGLERIAAAADASQERGSRRRIRWQLADGIKELRQRLVKQDVLVA